MKTVSFSHTIHPPRNWQKNFTPDEILIVKDVIRVLNASNFRRIKSGYQHSRYTEISIHGITIIYIEDEELPCTPGLQGFSFMNLEFYICCDAWNSRRSIIQTVAHELHRIHTSSIAVTGKLAAGDSTNETRNAHNFASKVSEAFV